MTVSNTTNKHYYSGTGSQTSFPYAFKVFAKTDLTVFIDGVLKTVDVDFTVSDVGIEDGGNVVFSTAPSVGTGNIAIVRQLALSQSVDLVQYGKFDAEVIEAQYDKIIMMVQQIKEQADRSIRFSASVSDVGAGEINDSIAERSGKVLAYDASGDLSVANELGDWQGDWSTASIYAVRDLVMDSATNNVYTCLVGHTAGTLATDVSSGRWALVIDAVAVAASATTATTQAGIATTKAGEASTSASTAYDYTIISSDKADDAAASATTASTKAGIATTKASEASTSAAAAAADLLLTNADVVSAEASKVAAEAAEVITLSAEADAQTFASNAAASGAAAIQYATLANNQAVSATTSASTATTKASEASASATASATSATASATSATTATTKASESATSATAAANSAASAAAAFDDFDDKYLGAKATEPTVNNDGDPLVTGNLYFLTGTGMQVWDGASWIAASSSGNVSMFAYEYTATAGQTTFSGSDINGQTLSYSSGNIHVTYGGLDIPVSDYTATNGTSIVLADGAEVGTIVRVTAFQSFVVADTYTQSQADVLLAAKAPLASPSFTGNVGIGTSSPDAKVSAQRTGSDQGVSGGYSLKGQDGTTQGGIGTDGVNDNYVQILAAQGVKIHTGNTDGTVNERMRIDSSGNVLVGKTNAYYGVAGVGIDQNGYIHAARSNDNPLILNRLSSDGNIALFKKDNTTVGSIGTEVADGTTPADLVITAGTNNASRLWLKGGDSGLMLDGNTNSILPTDENSYEDNRTNIGSGSYRFKDLYLSGGVDFGAATGGSGTSTSNKLDDYEEGTWTPTVSGAIILDSVGTYTKVGNLVHFQARVEWSNGTGASAFGGLPFTCSSGNESHHSMTVTPYVNSGFGGLPSGKGWLNGYVNNGGSDINWHWQPNSASAATTATGNVYFQGSYIAA